jgi:molecular chaperone GrpE (heat shock protein)
MWEAVAAWGVAVGTIAGLAALLGKKYFEKELELEDVRKSNVANVLSDLKSTVEDHKKAITNLLSSLDKTNSALLRTDADLKNIRNEMKEYSDAVGTRIIAFESKVMRLSEDLVIIKGQKR